MSDGSSSFFPGDMTSADWSDDRFIFWATLDPHTGEQIGISRTELKRDSLGRQRPYQRDTRSAFCDEHFDWEEVRRPISALEALRWAAETERETQRTQGGKLDE